MKEEKKKVYESWDVVIYEDGWWMKGKEYHMLKQYPELYGIDKNERTHELTLFLIPLNN